MRLWKKITAGNVSGTKRPPSGARPSSTVSMKENDALSEDGRVSRVEMYRMASAIAVDAKVCVLEIDFAAR